MKTKSPIIAVAAIVSILTISGCASRTELRELQSEVAALRALTEATDANAKKALANTEALRSDVVSARQAAESANKNSAATRAMMEQLDARLDGSGKTLK